MCKNKTGAVTVSRRRFLQAAGLGGLATAISACGSGAPTAPTEAPDVAPAIPTSAPLPTRASESSSSTQKSGDTSPQAKPEPTRTKAPYDANAVNVWSTISDPQFCDQFDGMAEGFAKDNPGTRINAVQCDGASGGANFAMLLKSRMDQDQPPDAILMAGDPTSNLVTADLLEPLDDLMQSSAYSNASSWPTNLLNVAMVQGKTYGLPLMLAPFALYYNAGAFEAKGISSKREDFPKTLDDLKRLSKQFTTWSGDALKTAGFLPGLKGGDLPIWFALNGGGLFDVVGNKFVIDQERNIEALQFILDWYKEEYHGDLARANIGGDFLSEDSVFGTPKAFQRGALAVASAAMIASETLAKQPLGEEAKNWNVAPYPIGPSGKDSLTGAFTLWAVLPKKAKHRDDGFKYVDYIGGKASAESLSFTFAFGTTTGAAATGTFVPGNKTIATPVGSKLVEQARGEAFAKDWLAFFQKQRDITTTLDTSPIVGSASDILGLQMDDVIRGKASAKDALQQTQKLCQTLLEQFLKMKN